MSSFWSRITELNLSRRRQAVREMRHDRIGNGSWKRTTARAQELDWLASAVWEFGRMKYEFYKNRTTVVDVAELSLRFRETRQAITKTLRLLEKYNLAEPTEFPQLWTLDVADLGQQPRDGCVPLICGHNESALFSV
jgi:hypothetical protein